MPPPSRPRRPKPPTADRTTKTGRWLDLIAYLLQHRFPVTREQIFSHVGGYRNDLERGADPASVRQTFERDKRELRAAAIEIETLDVPDAAGDEASRRLRPLRPSGVHDRPGAAVPRLRDLRAVGGDRRAAGRGHHGGARRHGR